LIFLGIINGGLGLQLASDSPAYNRAGMIVYSVLAGVLGGGLLALVLYTVIGGGKGEAKEKVLNERTV
jgi:hypothetical protein